MTRREKHMMALDLTEDYLVGDGNLTLEELLDGIRFARGRAEAPPWWAPAAFEMRATRREYREERQQVGSQE